MGVNIANVGWGTVTDQPLVSIWSLAKETTNNGIV